MNAIVIITQQKIKIIEEKKSNFKENKQEQMLVPCIYMSFSVARVSHFLDSIFTDAISYSGICLFGEQPTQSWPDGFQQSMRMDITNQKAGTVGTSTTAFSFPL